VAVFDPQRLATGIPSATRWSPIRGCENPQTAMVRAKALASGISDAIGQKVSEEQAFRALSRLMRRAGGGRSHLTGVLGM
jgi:type IV secretion system protein VirD4